MSHANSAEIRLSFSINLFFWVQAQFHLWWCLFLLLYHLKHLKNTGMSFPNHLVQKLKIWWYKCEICGVLVISSKLFGVCPMMLLSNKTFKKNWVDLVTSWSRGKLISCELIWWWLILWEFISWHRVLHLISSLYALVRIGSHKERVAILDNTTNTWYSLTCT